MKRLLPSLPLALLLFVVWLLLNQSVSPGTMVMGALLAILVPVGTKGLRPGHVPWYVCGGLADYPYCRK